MADRHLVATGNWSDPSIWSATSGGAGGAGVPTASDSVYIDANYVVTLVADATASYVLHTNGQLKLNSHTLTLGNSYYSYSSNARTLDISGSTLVVGVSVLFQSDNTKLTLVSSNSLVVINWSIAYSPGTTILQTVTEALWDVEINMGMGVTGSTGGDILGSPTFHSLIIQSKNTAAHTVHFPDIGSSPLKFEKLVAIGSSSSNKLTLSGGGMGSAFYYNSPAATSYGQFVNMTGIAPMYPGNPGDFAARYIGSNSTADTSWGSYGWLTKDPPKVSTLIDPLTTSPSSNSNWTVSGTVTQVTTGHSGGGYQLASDATLTSTDTYDLIDNDFIFELRGGTGNLRLELLRLAAQGSLGANYLDLYALGTGGMEIDKQWGSGGGQSWLPSDVSYLGFAKIRINSNGTISAYYSTDGGAWTAFPSTGGTQYSSTEVALMRSVRLTPNAYSGNSTIGSINPQLGPVPATADFTAMPPSGRAPLTVQFTDTSSGAPTSWSWNFGDGTTSTAQNPSHTYGKPGSYTVQLYASNSLGGSTKTQTNCITATATVVTPTSVASAEAFGTPTVARGGVTVSPDSVASAESAGAFTVMMTAQPDSVASAESVGSPAILTGIKYVMPDSVASAEAFGTPTILRDNFNVSVNGIASAESVAQPLVVPGGVTVGGVGDIAPQSAVGAPAIVQAAPPPPPPADWSALGREDKKEYLYKVYDSAGNFIGVWTDVVDEPQFSQQINTPGTTMTVQLGRSANTTKEVRNLLISQDGKQLITQDGNSLVVTGQTSNTVGEGTDIDLNYNVDIYVQYGGFNNLITQDGTLLVTQDGNQLVVPFGSPLGTRIFSGYIMDYTSSYGDQTGVTVTLSSNGAELSQEVIRSGAVTTVTYNSAPLESIAKSVLDTNPGKMSYDSSSIGVTGVSQTVTFQLNTKLEAIQSVYNQTPDGWYWFGNVADNLLYLKAASTTPDHVFYLGQHIKSVDVKRSIESLVNAVWFVGGQTNPSDPTTTVFHYYEDATSQTAWRKGIDRITDRRYLLTSSMQARAMKEIGKYKGPIFTMPVTISAGHYDIETIYLGQMVGFANFGNFIDGLVLQIVSLSYTPTAVTLQLGQLQDRQVDIVNDIQDGLQNDQFQAIPTQPT